MLPSGMSRPIEKSGIDEDESEPGLQKAAISRPMSLRRFSLSQSLSRRSPSRSPFLITWSW